MSKARWSKFWWDDWAADLALKSCSLSARGLWMEMLTIMHKSEKEGYFLIAGRAVSTRQLAGLVSAQEKEVVKCMGELEENRVFSTTEDGVIYSRRMLRDKAAREQAKEWGSTGGNPDLKGNVNGGNNSGGQGGVNPPVNAKDNGPVIVEENLTLNLQEAKKLEAKKTEKEESTPKAPKGALEDWKRDFKEFYGEYPRKKAPDDALKAYLQRRREGVPHAAIMAGLRRAEFSPDPTKIRYPAGWLRGGCWNDSDAPDDGLDPVLRAAGVTQADMDQMFGNHDEQPKSFDQRFLQ